MVSQYQAVVSFGGGVKDGMTVLNNNNRKTDKSQWLCKYNQKYRIINKFQNLLDCS